ncbi:hypothetical protein EVAR_99031_1 [Eumeta japonica]|uniref:Uncharacterized protein n=1 Tax=Eumeta variegata TaxID=151549 RepID=A0A4C2AI21_EUMVA|nr:hypothetical protein EVAR_99031_1 [Eumeta japonica]
MLVRFGHLTSTSGEDMRYESITAHTAETVIGMDTASEFDTRNVQCRELAAFITMRGSVASACVTADGCSWPRGLRSIDQQITYSRNQKIRSTLFDPDREVCLSVYKLHYDSMQNFRSNSFPVFS